MEYQSVEIFYPELCSLTPFYPLCLQKDDIAAVRVSKLYLIVGVKSGCEIILTPGMVVI